MTDSECLRIKLIVLGDSGVGKSSLVRRFVEDHFLPNEPATIGYDFKPFNVDVDGESVQFNIWVSYISGFFNYFEFYDVIRIRLVLSDIAVTSHLRFTGVLTERSMTDRDVTKREGSEFARKSGMIFLETSAKTSENVRDAFIELARKILQDPEFRAAHTPAPIGLVLDQTAVEQQERNSACGC